MEMQDTSKEQSTAAKAGAAKESEKISGTKALECNEQMTGEVEEGK